MRNVRCFDGPRVGKHALMDWLTAVIVVAPLTGFLLYAWLAK